MEAINSFKDKCNTLECLQQEFQNLPENVSELILNPNLKRILDNFLLELNEKKTELEFYDSENLELKIAIVKIRNAIYLTLKIFQAECLMYSTI